MSWSVPAKTSRVPDSEASRQAKRLRQDRRARQVVKGACWLLQRSRQNLTREADQVRLRELLAANCALMTVYLLNDDLKRLWQYRHEGYARLFWHGWYGRAIRSHIEPLKAFARRLKAYLPGILAHCRFPLHTGLLEGINNRIKVITHIAFGFRHDEYFFLKKICAEFPGIASETTFQDSGRATVLRSSRESPVHRGRARSHFANAVSKYPLRENLEVVVPSPTRSPVRSAA